MRIALLGDLHTFRYYAHPWQLLNKRPIGLLNLYLNRRKKFKHKYLPALLNHLQQQSPQTLLLTGDLTTTGLPSEFKDAYKTLKPLLDKYKTHLVPGNHDRYIPSITKQKLLEKHFPNQTPKSYPNLQPLHGKWQLLSINASIPRGLNAQGKLGQDQLEKIKSLTQNLTESDGLIILSHYPIYSPANQHNHKNHELLDATQLQQTLQASPAKQIYIHGHIHKPWLLKLPISQHPFTLSLNTGAPVMTSPLYPQGQGYWTIDLPQNTQDKITFNHYAPTPNDDDTYSISLTATKKYDTSIDTKKLNYRKPTTDEIRLIKYLIPLNSGLYISDEVDSTIMVNELRGGMGSLEITTISDKSHDTRQFGNRISDCQFNDIDGICVIASLHLDKEGSLFELDIWKTDSSDLIKIPENSTFSPV